MAITIKKGNETIVLRNLEEQVQKNKEDIAAHYAIDRVLADFGIRVIGQVDNESELPENGDFNYGDSYAVGTEPPYSFYIWTRADVNQGRDEDYWFNVGELAIVGPQGPQGEQGPKGDTGQSSTWYSINTQGPPTISNARTGDMCIDSSAQVWRYTNNTWVSVINIKGAQGIQGVQGPQGNRGPQGPQGPQGLAGPPGSIYRLIGKVTTTSALPTPTESIRQNAYLVNDDIYAITGDTTLIWTNFGPLDFGSQITVNGQYVQTYEMNNKANKNAPQFTNGINLVAEDGSDYSITISAPTNTMLMFEDSYGDSATLDLSSGYLSINGNQVGGAKLYKHNYTLNQTYPYSGTFTFYTINTNPYNTGFENIFTGRGAGLLKCSGVYNLSSDQGDNAFAYEIYINGQDETFEIKYVAPYLPNQFNGPQGVTTGTSGRLTMFSDGTITESIQEL